MIKKRGIFINNKKAKDSIFESGFMVYQCLKLSNEYELDYCEIDANNRVIKTGYDFYFFNYHPITMQWLDTKSLRKNLGFVMTMILEVSPNDAFVLCPENDFDVYCALDPTIRSHKNLFAFPRPLEKADFQLPEYKSETPIIGSFGFATKGKGFQHVIEAVNKEFEKAIVRINIPYGDYVPNSDKYAFFLGDLCRKTAKPGIEVQVTHEFMSKEELIRWCAANTLNCFLYDRSMPGLSATTDQAITSGRPIAVSGNETFRHITAYIKPYPEMSLQDSIRQSVPLVKQMAADWQPEKFKERFEEVLHLTHTARPVKTTGNTFELQIRKKNLSYKIEKKVKKYKRKLKKFSITGMFKSKKKNELI